MLVEGLRIHFGLKHCLLHGAVGTELLRHASFSLGLTCIQLLILHLWGLCIVLAGLHSEILGLLNFPSRFHFFLFGDPLLRRQILELVLLVVRLLLVLLSSNNLLLLLLLHCRLCFKGRIILNVDSIGGTPSTGKTSVVYKVYHFLAYNGHLKNLSDRGTLLSIFVQHCID